MSTSVTFPMVGATLILLSHAQTWTILLSHATLFRLTYGLLIYMSLHPFVYHLFFKKKNVFALVSLQYFLKRKRYLIVFITSAILLAVCSKIDFKFGLNLHLCSMGSWPTKIPCTKEDMWWWFNLVLKLFSVSQKVISIAVLVFTYWSKWSSI